MVFMVFAHVAFAAIAVFMAGCDRSGSSAVVRSTQHPESNPAAPCACADARLNHGWCPRCNLGYVAGRQITDHQLFEVIDAHGHDLGRESFACDSCRAAFDAGEFCSPCGNGFVRGQTYFTRLTWGLAQGEPFDPATITCTACRGHVNASGWCEACNRGIVGNVAFTSRAPYDVAVQEYAVLDTAIAKVPSCGMCACAMMVHRVCPTCLTSYEHLAAASTRRPEPVSRQGS